MSSLSEKKIEELVMELASEDETERKTAEETLCRAKDPNAIKHLRRALEAGNDLAINVLADMLPNNEALATIIHSLEILKPECIEVRKKALTALKNLLILAKNTSREMQRISQDPESSGDAIELDKFDDTTFVRIFIRALQDPESDIRIDACNALEETTNPIACPALCDALKDRNDAVRQAAAARLRHIKGNSFHPLVAALRDSNIVVRIKVSYALVENYGLRALPYVMKASRGIEAIEDHVHEILVRYKARNSRLFEVLAVFGEFGIFMDEETMKLDLTKGLIFSNLEPSAVFRKRSSEEKARLLIEFSFSFPEIRYDGWEGLRRLEETEAECGIESGFKRFDSVINVSFNKALSAMKGGSDDERLSAIVDLCVLEFLKQGEYERVYELAESARTELLLTNNIARIAGDVLANTEGARREALQAQVGNLAEKILRKSKRDMRMEGMHRSWIGRKMDGALQALTGARRLRVA